MDGNNKIVVRKIYKLKILTQQQGIKMGKEEVNRRKYLQIAGATIGGVLIGAAAGWYGKPREVLEKMVTETVERTVTKTVTTTAPPVTPTLTPTPTPTPTPELIASWYKKAAEPYGGTTIKVLAQGWEPNYYLRDVVGPKFTDITGITIDWELTSNELVMEKEMLDMEKGTGIYACTYDDQDMVGTWIKKGWVYDLTEFMGGHPELVDPWLDLDDIWSIPYCSDPRGHVLTIPCEYYPKTYVYRTDLFEDPTEKSNFKAKYGYDLKKPTYYDECLDAAEFFTRPDKDLYGFVGGCGAKTHEALGFDFFESWFPTHGAQSVGLEPYGKPVLPWGINVETWGASMARGGMLDSPQAVKAIEDFLTLGVKDAPPGVEMMIYVEAAEQVAAGRVAQTVTYTQFLSTFANPEVSKIAGKFKCDLPPVDREYWKPGMALAYADISGYCIPLHSKHPEAAWLWMQFAVSPLNELERAKTINTTVRTSVLMDPALNAVDAKFGGVFSLLRDPEKAKLYVGTPTEIGEYAALLYIYYTVLGKAVAGELTPEECAKELASTIDEKFHEWGYW